MDHAISALRAYLEHEWDRRYDLTNLVRKHRKDRETERAKDHAEYAFAQLQFERDVRSLVGELGTALMTISRLREEISSVRIHNDRLDRERKNLMDVLERGSYLHRRKRTCTDSTGGDVPRRT